jgi:hypothetical protein
MFARDDPHKKCRVDQAERIHHSSAMVDPALRALIHPTGWRACAQWIPAFAGMRGWPRATRGRACFSVFTAMPVKAAFMRLTAHVPPIPKRHAAGDANKYNVKINYAGLLFRRCNERDRLALVASVNPKISAIHGNHAVFWINFAHADQA